VIFIKQFRLHCTRRLVLRWLCHWVQLTEPKGSLVSGGGAILSSWKRGGNRGTKTGNMFCFTGGCCFTVTTYLSCLIFSSSSTVLHAIVIIQFSSVPWLETNWRRGRDVGCWVIEGTAVSLLGSGYRDRIILVACCHMPLVRIFVSSISCVEDICT
jgi:hypothetical protein